MIQNWNKFNESDDIDKEMSEHNKLKQQYAEQKSVEFKNMLEILKSDNDINITTYDIEQLLFNLLDNYDFEFINTSGDRVREGYTTGHPELIVDTLNFTLSTKPFIREYLDPLKFTAVRPREDMNRAVSVNLMNLSNLKEATQDKKTKMYYCYLTTLLLIEDDGNGNEAEIDDENEEFIKELDYIKKRGSSLINGYCQYKIYHNEIAILLYVEIDKSSLLEKTRPDYYKQLPEKVRDEMHDFIIDNNLPDLAIFKLIEMINKANK